MISTGDWVPTLQIKVIVSNMKFKNEKNMRFEDYNHYTKDIYVIRKDGVHISGKDFLSIIDKLEKGLNVKFDDTSPVGS